MRAFGKEKDDQRLLEKAAKTADAKQIDHGLLLSLEADHHLHYHNDTRAGVWHSELSGSHVTNGDSHNHAGGDGGQVDHSSLGSIGSNTHSQIDDHLSSVENPHSVTANQVLPAQTGNAGKYLSTDGGNASWQAGGTPPIYARVTGSNATTTGQTLVAVTGLSVALEANAVYEFEACLLCSVSAVTTGNSYGINFDAAGASVEAQIFGATTATAMRSFRLNAFNSSRGPFITSSGGSGGIIIKGIVTTGANPGNLVVQHLKVTSGTSTVFIDSFLKALKVA